jgi:pimeloyl-ACP methyl ester carboxylesterase
MTDETSAENAPTERQEPAPAQVSPAPELRERGVVAKGQRVASVMNDTPRAFLARAPLVVLPATGYTWQDYRPVLEHFAAERRVFALDWPGFGGSAKPDPAAFAYDAASYAEVLAEWMDALGLGRAVLLGNGIGGTVALRYAAAQPPRVLGLVLVAPQGFGAQGPMHRLAMGAFGAPIFSSMLDPMLAWLALGPTTPDVKRVINRKRMLRRSPDYAAYEVARNRLVRNEARSHANLATLAREIRAPALVVRGALDPIFTAADARRAAESIGAHRALEVMLPGAGHLPFLQEPSRFYQAVDGLLNVAEMKALEEAPPQPPTS